MDTNLPEQISAAKQQNMTTSSKARIRPAFLVLQGLIAAAIVFASGLYMQSLLADKSPPNQRPVREQVFTVDTIVATRGDHRPNISVFGNVVAGNVLDLRTELAGPLIEVNPAVRSGAVVSAGTVLARIDPFDYETALAEAENDLLDANAQLMEAEARLASETADLANAKAQLALAEKDLERAEALVKRGSVTQQTVDQRQQSLLQQKASVDSATATLQIEETKLLQQKTLIDRFLLQKKRAERDLSLTTLIAPVDAVVESEAITLGQIVTANQTIAQLMDLSAFEAKFNLSDEQYGRLTGQSASISGMPIDVLWKTGQRAVELSGTVSRVGSSISTDLGGVTLYAKLNNLAKETDLRPGAFVEIRLPDRIYRNTFQLPEAAIYEENRIYVVDEGRLKSVAVEVLAFTGSEVILTGNLPTEAKVLTTRIAEVGDGLRVRDSAAPPEIRPDGLRRENGSQKKPAAANSAEVTPDDDSKSAQGEAPKS
ncbi:MAG: HlyD family efflux transporter periplasmic adaptor subunit [Hyphomicrobiales bacterium]